MTAESVVDACTQCLAYYFRHLVSEKNPARCNTVVVLLDDLQNSDVLSWKVLERLLATNLGELKLFVVASFRYPLPNELCENHSRSYEDASNQLGVNLVKSAPEYSELVAFLDCQLSLLERRAKIIPLDVLAYSDIKKIILGFFGFFFRSEVTGKPIHTQLQQTSSGRFLQVICEKIIRAKGLDASPWLLLSYLYEMGRHKQIILKIVSQATHTGILSLSEDFLEVSQNKQQLKMPIPNFIFSLQSGLIRTLFAEQPQLAAVIKLMSPFRKLFDYDQLKHMTAYLGTEFSSPDVLVKLARQLSGSQLTDCLFLNAHDEEICYRFNVFTFPLLPDCLFQSLDLGQQELLHQLSSAILLQQAILSSLETDSKQRTNELLIDFYCHKDLSYSSQLTSDQQRIVQQAHFNTEFSAKYFDAENGIQAERPLLTTDKLKKRVRKRA